MEGVLSQKMSPLLKCILLFLFIFTAKVLTSRPHESQDSRNEIQHSKPAHYVRTFTKYHHRRTIQWNSFDPTNWPATQDQPKVIGKRSVDGPNSKILLTPEAVDSTLSQYASEYVRSDIIDFDKTAISSKDHSPHNGVSNDVKQYKMKAAAVVTKAPTTPGPSITCLYKIHNLAMSVTPTIDAKYTERTDQLTVESETFDTGVVSETTLPNGEVVQIQQCTNPRAYCYTLWHQENEGNITVLGQGCWHSSQSEGRSPCDKCTRVTAKLPASKFCCCTKSYCNADFTSLKEETVTIKAQSTMDTSSASPSYSNMAASGILGVIAMLLTVVVLHKMYCKRVELDKDDLSDGIDVEKGDTMGSGPDALATGLLCVDNLTLIEHIGQGKFGSVWRGTLGATPVAVKLYSNAAAWQKEAAVYSLPHLAHPNILKYYGSDTRTSLTEGGAREHLLVLELCSGTLRSRLQQAPLGWLEFATLAHGVAAALAHLHAPSGNKPCVVHRDVNSSNVLVCWGGRARLADLGLAQCVPQGPHSHHPHAPSHLHTPARYSEAGTLRYLSPEALEGALDLSGARAALCAVDVFALGLVLWEMLWRCAPAHPHGRAPPYALPYQHHGLPARPSLAQMQSLVSRNKARPPLPKGPVPEARALKIASDTCDECWDHDAEARLTAVCVEERMVELKMMLLVQGPVIHDNNLHPNLPSQGKFGSVWRGTLGATPVAVKLYSNAVAWQKEAAVYSLPHLAHPNILKYYGSDTRISLTEGGAREHLLVFELCSGTLRSRLQRAPLSWLEFATLAHGLAAALAHLHTPTGNKPCVVHRDVNSSNVLVCWGGRARLADLGQAQCIPQGPHAPPHLDTPTRLSEVGTLRYLSPEALEGALDLSGARAALCAVDVYALGLVLWEMLWRCAPAHPHGRAPPYAQPYQHHGLPAMPTLAQMQSLVSRNKARPPLPKGPVPEARALKIASDTCEECWDHDAEARLTAVCVEERMTELKSMVLVQGPVIYDNNLHPHLQTDANGGSQPEADKNSNCTSSQNGDVTTPLLYPHPHMGRNACIERNTHTNTQTHADVFIHKSLKDITAPIEVPRTQNVQENCLSVARISHNRLQTQENSDRFNEIRSYQRPLDYVQNDVSSHEVDRGLKQTNILQDIKVEKPKWGIRKFFEKRLGRAKETEVKLVAESSNSVQNGRTMTSIIDKPCNIPFATIPPANLVLNQDITYNFEPCTLSPPNRTLSPTMMIESEMNTDKVFKELPSDTDSKNQIFAVIVPKVKPADLSRSKTSGSTESIHKRSVRTSMSSQSIFKAGHSESEDSTVKKRLSCDNRIISNSSNSGRSSRASINLELQYIDNNQTENCNGNESPFDMNSDCSSSEDEHLMLLSENGGSKITMQTIPKTVENDKKKYQNDVLKEATQAKTDFGFNKFQNKYTNFDNEFSDPNDKENLVNGYSGDNPVYLAALNGEIDTSDLKLPETSDKNPNPKPSLKSLSIKRQHSLEQVSEIFTSAGDINLLNPAGRVKTPGDLPVAVRRARRDRALQKGRASECNRLSLYDDRMMFGNSL